VPSPEQSRHISMALKGKALTECVRETGRGGKEPAQEGRTDGLGTRIWAQVAIAISRQHRP